MKSIFKFLRHQVIIFALFMSIFLLSFQACNLFDSDSDKKAEQELIRKILLALVNRPACERNSTGTVYFLNTSNSNKTYDIIWDGSHLTTIAPNARTDTYTVASGQHTLLFKVTNTNTTACSQSTPNIAVCSGFYYSCSY